MRCPSGFVIDARDILAGSDRSESQHADPVVFLDHVVGGRIGEGEREQACFFRLVSWMRAKRAGQDHEPTAMARLHGGMLADEPSP